MIIFIVYRYIVIKNSISDAGWISLVCKSLVRSVKTERNHPSTHSLPTVRVLLSYHFH